VLVTLLREMKRTDARYELATLCIGGGQGIATMVENKSKSRFIDSEGLGIYQMLLKPVF
jgi:hypothetical protein